MKKKSFAVFVLFFVFFRGEILPAMAAPSDVLTLYTPMPDADAEKLIGVFNKAMYNTQLPGPSPSDWRDMVSEEAAGRVSMASPLYSGTAASMHRFSRLFE